MLLRATILAVMLIPPTAALAFAEDEPAPKTVHEVPPVFRALGFAAAASRAKDDGRLLIIDCMTSWCGPCKHMDKTTWRDEKLVVWIGEHAIAIQVDMEKHLEVKDQLGVTAFPTIVVMKDEKELERVVGGRDAKFMSEWLDLLRQGKTRKQVVLQRTQALRAEKGEQLTADDRLAMLADLTEVGLFEAASTECLWLWQNVASWAPNPRTPARYRLLGATRSVAQRHPPARAALGGVRDTIAPGTSATRLVDWYWLNQILREEERTVAWARESATTEEGMKQLRELGNMAVDSLIGRGAWRAAGICIQNPLPRAQLYARWDQPNPGNKMMPMLRAPRRRPHVIVPDAPAPMPRKAPPKQAEEGKKTAPPTRGNRMNRHVEDVVSDLYAALLAAGRTQEAIAVAAELLRYRDTPRARTSLVAKTLEAGCFEERREAHRAWLDEAIR